MVLGFEWAILNIKGGKLRFRKSEIDEMVNAPRRKSILAYNLLKKPLVMPISIGGVR